MLEIAITVGLRFLCMFVYAYNHMHCHESCGIISEVQTQDDDKDEHIQLKLF